MNANALLGVSAQATDETFDLLARNAREYAVFLIDRAGQLLCWNAGAEHLFGYEAQEIIGQHQSRFFGPEDILAGQPGRELERALASGHAASTCWQIRRDGTRFWCRSTVTTLLDENKLPRSFARVVHDLTESEAVLAERRRADGLAEANRSKEEFMAVLSHELRSPLSPILNAVDVLRQMNSSDPIVEQAGNIIDRQVGRMERLVDDLLDINRIAMGKLRLCKEDVDLGVVVNHAVETARPHLEARKHEFSTSFPAKPIWVAADAMRIEQVVVNLLNNAAKYTDEGGNIRIAVTQDGADAAIRVQDNGVGIRPEDVNQIFDLFAQIDGSLGRSYGGLGIGLALARSLIAMHDGSLQARSAGLGKGCEFTIKLPILLAPAVREANTVLDTESPTEAPLRVLVVEDDVDGGDAMSMVLRAYGHNVQLARTGPTAVELAPSFRPDLVLLDIGLPGMDGYEVAKRLRERPELEGVTIVALTGYTPNEADCQRQQESGIDHYYTKPVAVKKLLDLFKAIVATAS